MSHLAGRAVVGLCCPAWRPSRTGSPIPCSGSYRRQIKHGGVSQAGSEPRGPCRGWFGMGRQGRALPTQPLGTVQLQPRSWRGSGCGLPAAPSSATCARAGEMQRRAQAARRGGMSAF